MERNKQTAGPSGRGPKAKITQQPPDLFIALGAKQSSPRDDPKRSVPLPKTTTSSHLPGTSLPDKLKREGTQSALASAPNAKKLKVTMPGSRPIIPGPSSAGITPIERMGAVESWEALALDCDATELFESIMQAINAGNTDKAVSYVLGVLKMLKYQRSKMCRVIYLSLLLACNCKPSLFTNEAIVGAIVGIMRRDCALGPKMIAKSHQYFHILFLNLMSYAFADVAHWPEGFVKIYVEDAVSDRLFIDNPFCKPFVDNVVTAFNTKLPPSSLLKSETWNSAARDTSSPLTITSFDDESKNDVLSEHKAIVDSWNVRVFPRFTQCQENIEKIVLEAIKEQITRRQQPETVTKNFVRFLSTACGLVEIRIIAVSRIESWLHNHKLMKPAQELLAYLCYNCSASSQRDLEIIAQLSKLRLKNKPMINFFNNCLREMVYSFPENLYPLLKYTLYNELSNARNANNLIVVGAMFQVAPEASADAFVDICLELLLNKDDYLRALRGLLKETTRALRHDFNLLSIVHSLLRERKTFTDTVRESEFQNRIFLSLADLICMCMLLCVSPQVRDASTQSKRDVAILRVYQKQVSNIQREAVTWLNDWALKVFRPSVGDFHHVLLKVLFLEQAEHYCKIDSWPGENERNLFLRLTSEVPVMQATLLRLLLIGGSKEHPITPTEIVEISDQLIRRAANLPQDCLPPLDFDGVEIVRIFLNLCSYNYPENITLPTGYVPPQLAIAGLYWKVWLVLLILAAHNPLTVGNEVWNKYPTLRMFMEMCITNHFSFPPPTILDEDYQSRESQILALEKQKILEFESHLAAASTKMEITEQTSLLLPQLIELRPEGEARRPPQPVLDQLQHLNHTHRLGHLLCKSRNPDFLLDIMSRQGGTMAHMPWLAELVHSSEGALAHLPVQCLCEYLLSTAPAEKLTKHGQLLSHLRTVVNENDPQTACEVLEYLFRRLTSDFAASRTQATKGLNLILAPSGDDTETNNTQWLIKYITQFPHFAIIKPVLVQFLRQALQIETNPARVSSYINFLSTQECESFTELHELVADLSSVIIERHSVASYVLPGENSVTLKNLLSIFACHIQRAHEFGEDWSSLLPNYTEYVLVTWSGGQQCHLQTLVIHAAIVLLTYGPLDHFAPFETLLDFWFPSNGDTMPAAFVPETHEATSYLPDWMKLRMIRSNVPRLVDAAIEKLEPPKLVLFIQSFGIPTMSISKLLSTLDRATQKDAKLVVDSVLDKTYMIQLVEVQNKRGAKGGETFVKAIEMQMPPVQDIEVNVDVESKKQLPDFSQKKRASNQEELLTVLANVFNPHRPSGFKNTDIMLLTKLAFDQRSVDLIFDYVRTVPPAFVLPVLTQHANSISTIFRLIFSKTTVERVGMAKKLLSLMTQDKSNSIIHILQQFLINSDNFEKTDVKMEEHVNENQGEKLEKMLADVKTDVEKTGVLVDWLSTTELEVVYGQKQKFQKDLLFSKENLSFRPLLMSLVLQRASWQSLHTILDYLFEENQQICPVSALDFLCALTQSPKMWQGRDKAIPKHHHSEDVLHLDKNKALILVKYILDESRLEQPHWQKKMETRLTLLLKCITSSATYILTELLKTCKNDPYSRELLLLMYMSLPSCGQDLLDNMSILCKEAYEKNCTSGADELSHCLLSAMAATPRVKDWPRKSQDLEMCARKLAATHPILVLRQLPMLAGSLKGRAQYDWGVLKNRGHLMLFGQVLGLLELLKPMVFQQGKTLCDIMDSYFLLLHFHGHMKDHIVALVQRIVVFVQCWMTYDMKTVGKYLQEHGSVLTDIQTGLPLGQNTPSELLIRAVMSPVSDSLPANWPQLMSALRSGENLQALHELDHLTSKKSHLLEAPSQYLYNFITSPNGMVRNLSLTLIIRWLKFNPKAAKQVLPAILISLGSENGDVVASVLDRLSDLVSVMQEYGKVILTRVFQLGMDSTMNTTSNITKSIDLLNLQSGC